MKVNFMIIGSAKSGTSSLFTLLSKHPKIVFSNPKEPQFFSNDKNWKKNIDKYHDCFEKSIDEGVLLGEASTNYTKYPHYNLEIWNDLYEYNPDLKLIYIIREPIERCISHYMHLYQRENINMNIESAIINYPEIINTSRYFMQIEPYIEKFGKDNVLLLNFDEFMKNKNSSLDKIGNLLSIDLSKLYDTPLPHSNKSLGRVRQKFKADKQIEIFNWLQKFIPGRFRDPIRLHFFVSKRKFENKPVLSEELKNYIKRALVSDIVEIERITGWNLESWK